MVKCIIFDFFNVLYPYSPEATEVVKTMRERGYKLGAISSMNPEMVREIADHYKIDYVFSSCATCLSKSEPLIYERFLQEFGLTGSECVMIDDDSSRLLAAKQVGIKVIWLTQVDTDEVSSIDYTIKNIEDLKSLKL